MNRKGLAKITAVGVSIFFLSVFLFFVKNYIEEVSADPAWWNSTWDRCRNLTHDDPLGTDKTRTFEPVGMGWGTNITGLNLTSGEEIRIVDTHCDNDGNDIPRDIISWGSTWVFVIYQVNRTAGTNTTYSIYYQNDSAVETPDYSSGSDLDWIAGTWTLNNTYVSIDWNESAGVAQNITHRTEDETDWTGSFGFINVRRFSGPTAGDETAVFRGEQVSGVDCTLDFDGYVMKQINCLNSDLEWNHTVTVYNRYRPMKHTIIPNASDSGNYMVPEDQTVGAVGGSPVTSTYKFGNSSRTTGALSSAWISDSGTIEDKWKQYWNASRSDSLFQVWNTSAQCGGQYGHIYMMFWMYNDGSDKVCQLADGNHTVWHGFGADQTESSVPWEEIQNPLTIDIGNEQSETPGDNPPTYSNVGTNSTFISGGDLISFNSQADDDVQLSRYIFSWNVSRYWNCTGGWTNDTTQEYQSGNWTNTTRMIPEACAGNVLGYRFYYNDSANQWNDTGIQTITIQNMLLDVYVNDSLEYDDNSSWEFIGVVPQKLEYYPNATDSLEGTITYNTNATDGSWNNTRWLFEPVFNDSDIYVIMFNATNTSHTMRKVVDLYVFRNESLWERYGQVIDNLYSWEYLQSANPFTALNTTWDPDWKMYYVCRDGILGTCFANSTDGITWVERGNIYNASSPGAPNGPHKVTVMNKPDGSAGCHMWNAEDAGAVRRIYYANTSDADCIDDWQGYGVVLEGTESWEQDQSGNSWIDDPMVIYEDTTYKMWYACGKGTGAEPRYWCYAESANGLNWTKSEYNPIHVNGTSDDYYYYSWAGHSVYTEDGKNAYWAYGAGLPNLGSVLPYQLGVHMSKDGIHWIDFPANPILEENTSDASNFDYNGVAIGWVNKVDNDYYIHYNAINSTGSGYESLGLHRLYDPYPPPTEIDVTLNYPADDSTNASTSIDHGYTPVALNTSIYNCSLYNNMTSWSLKHANASAVVNNSVNIIQEVYSDDTLYIWNIRCCNDTSCWFADSNYTLTIDVSGVPDITIHHPTNTTYDTSDVDFNFTVTDAQDSTFHVRAYNNSATEFYDNSSYPNNTLESFTISRSDGSYYVRVWANDSDADVDDNTVYYTIYTAGGDNTPYWNNEGPTNNSILDYTTSVQLNLTAYDSDIGLLNVSFYNNTGGLIGTDIDVSNGSVATVTWSGLSAGSWTWSANITDGTNINSTGNLAFEIWWNTSWSSKLPIYLWTSNGTTEQDFQVAFNVSYISSMQSDFDDIRFINGSENTQLDYWLQEKLDDEWAYFWVEIDQNITSTSNYTIYMYYNNPSVSSELNGTATFLFFDDFDDGDYTNNPTWTVNSGTWNASGNYLERVNAGWGHIYTDQPYATGVWEWRMNVSGDSQTYFIDNASTEGGNHEYAYFLYLTPAYSWFRLYKQIGGVDTMILDNNTAVSVGWHNYMIARDNSTGLLEMFFDGNSRGSITNTEVNVSDYILLRTSTANTMWDTLRIRKYFNETVSYEIQTYYLRIETFDEETLEQLTFNVTISNSTTSDTWTNQTTFYQLTENLPLGEITISIENYTGGYAEREYYETLYSDSQESMNAYLLKNIDGWLVRIYVKTYNNVPIANATVTARTTINGSSQIVAQGTTDSAGVTGIYLSLTTTYQITVVAGGYGTVTHSVTPVTQDYTIYLTAEAIEPFWHELYNVTWSFTPARIEANETTFELQIACNDSGLQYYGMNLTQRNSTGTFNFFTLNVTDQSSGGNITTTYDFTNTSGNVTVELWFKHEDYDEFQWSTVLYIYVTSGGLTEVITSTGSLLHPLATGLIALFTSLAAGGLASRRITLLGGGILSLAILGIFMFAGWIAWEIFALAAMAVVAFIFMKSGI